jgi:hypothetical protein
MAYYDVAQLSNDSDFLARCAAAYSTETLASADRENPSQWISDHAWDMASQPGFGDAYASAIAGGVERPGMDPAVITDGQILSAMQASVGP